MRAKARRKIGPGVGPRAEGFFRLDFLLLLCQDKRSSPCGNEQTEYVIKTRTCHSEGRRIFFDKQSGNAEPNYMVQKILRPSE